MKRSIEIVVLSDTHLGTYACHAKELLNYLKSIKPKILILNGDFIDMWYLKKSNFPQKHIQIIQEILKMAAKGTKIYYITGNHDDGLRRYSDFASGNIHLRDKLVLHLNNEKYWVFHGDVFDSFIKYSPFIAKLGSKGYNLLIWINRFINKVRVNFGYQRRSFAKKIKSKVKEASKFIKDFEDTAIKLAQEQGYDYVICGHIHRPQIRAVITNGKKTTYLNSGDWVENLTALEYNFGKWSIYEYDELDFEYINPKLHVKKDTISKKAIPEISAQAVFEEIMSQTSQH